MGGKNKKKNSSKPQGQGTAPLGGVKVTYTAAKGRGRGFRSQTASETQSSVVQEITYKDVLRKFADAANDKSDSEVAGKQSRRGFTNQTVSETQSYEVQGMTAEDFIQKVVDVGNMECSSNVAESEMEIVSAPEEASDAVISTEGDWNKAVSDENFPARSENVVSESEIKSQREGSCWDRRSGPENFDRNSSQWSVSSSHAQKPASGFGLQTSSDGTKRNRRDDHGKSNYEANRSENVESDSKREDTSGGGRSGPQKFQSNSSQQSNSYRKPDYPSDHQSSWDHKTNRNQREHQGENKYERNRTYYRSSDNRSNEGGRDNKRGTSYDSKDSGFHASGPPRSYERDQNNERGTFNNSRYNRTQREQGNEGGASYRSSKDSNYGGNKYQQKDSFERPSRKGAGGGNYQDTRPEKRSGFDNTPWKGQAKNEKRDGSDGFKNKTEEMQQTGKDSEGKWGNWEDTVKIGDQEGSIEIGRTAKGATSKSQNTDEYKEESGGSSDRTVNRGKDRKSFNSSSALDPLAKSFNSSTALDASAKSYDSSTGRGYQRDSSDFSCSSTNYYNDDEYKEFINYLRQSKHDFVKVAEIEKDLFKMENEYALAHCVAEDMNMGSGIAVEFSRRYKRRGELYAQQAGTGGLAVLEVDGRSLYYLVTKRRSHEKPTQYTLWQSLLKLQEHVERHNIKKLAMPRIGCGLDRLEWHKVKRMLEYVFRSTDIEIVVCNLEQNEDSPQMPQRSWTCPVTNVSYPLVEIEKGTAIIYLGSEDGQVTDVINDLDTKFRILQEYKCAKRNAGDIVTSTRHNGSFDLHGFIVRKKSTDPLDFVQFQECTLKLRKLNKNRMEYAGIQAFSDEKDGLIMTKIVNILRHMLFNMYVYVCWPGDMQKWMPESNRGDW